MPITFTSKNGVVSVVTPEQDIYQLPLALAQAIQAAIDAAQLTQEDFAQFQAAYIGASDTPPTEDANGNPVKVGALYFDTVSNTLQVYGSEGWQASGSAIDVFITGNSPDAGALGGTDQIALTRGAGLLKTTLSTLAAWVLGTYQGFIQTGSTLRRTVTSKLQETVDLSDFPGYDPTGATDSSAALTLACASLPSGGEIRWRGALYLSRNFTLPDGITLRGFNAAPGFIASEIYSLAAYPSILVLAPTATVTQGNRSVVRRGLVINSQFMPNGAYPLPFGLSGAAAGIAAFSGTAFAPNMNGTSDNRLEDLLVLGFQYAYNGVGCVNNSRPQFRNVRGDCTNGISVSAVYDVGRADDCHFWPFMTVVEGGTTPAYLLRSGTAFYTEVGSTWFKWRDCFAYGYAISHDVNGVRNVEQLGCGADSTAASTSIGFQYRGAINNCVNVSGIAAGNGNCSVLINTTVDGNGNNIDIIGMNHHGSNSANGYINVVAGHATITANTFDGNSPYGHVNLQNAASLVSMVNCTHMGVGTAAPIYGNATAIANMQILNPNNLGTFSTAVQAKIRGVTSNTTMSVTVASGSGVLGVDRPAANYGIVRYRTSGVDRWWHGANVTAEAGSNAGSDWDLMRYSDTGTFLGYSIRAMRATGYVGIGTATVGSMLTVAGPIAPLKASTVTTATYTQVATDSTLIFNGTAAQTVTLLAASAVPGQKLHVKNIAAFAVASASSNVVPLTSATAGTAILAATAGKWATLQSDGTNWNIIAGN